VVNIAHNARNIVRALANGAIIFIREANRAKAETWSIVWCNAVYQSTRALEQVIRITVALQRNRS
jgi:hypothetical protein